MTSRKDKYTGQTLKPIQVWVMPSVRRAFAAVAKSERSNTQDKLRSYIESVVEDGSMRE